MANLDKNWYVVYTKPRWEKKVADLFGKKKIEHYCPINLVQRQWSDRKKLVAEPLFTSYVFVKASEPDLLSVRSTDGVMNFVYWLGKPAIVREEEIQAIRDFLTDYRNIQLEKVPVNPHDMVRVIGGPLVTQKGQVLSVKNKSAKVILPSLGFMMYAELQTSNLELVREENTSYFKKQQWLYDFR